MLRLGQPLAQARGDRRRLELRAHDVAAQELGLDELTEILADLVLAVRDDRGVRDRDAERMPEQRRHGEPVGERPDHAAFGERAHVRERGDLLLEREGEREEHRHEHERTEGDALHEPQPPTALLVRRTEQGRRRRRHALILARGLDAGGGLTRRARLARRSLTIYV
jgi:hypothetical protein